MNLAGVRRQLRKRANGGAERRRRSPQPWIPDLDIDDFVPFRAAGDPELPWRRPSAVRDWPPAGICRDLDDLRPGFLREAAATVATPIHAFTVRPRNEEA
jgi:hypothetical protein